MISVGTQAPNFTLNDSQGKPVTLSTLLEDNQIVLYFYPKDRTPGCTKEAQDFSDHADAFESLGAKIVGISGDSVESHRSFCKAYGLNITLLSDPDLVVHKLYGTWTEKKQHEKTYMGTARTTFLIGRDGIVKKVWEQVRVNGHVEKVLNEIV